MTTLTDQQKARIVELAQQCFHGLRVAAAEPVDAFRCGNYWKDQAAKASAEAFRIAQSAN